VGGEGGGECQGRRLTSQTNGLITSGILEYWNSGIMGNGRKLKKNEYWICLVED
jgi:hypothetical protein